MLVQMTLLQKWQKLDVFAEIKTDELEESLAPRHRADDPILSLTTAHI
jgi:hypothetical protein